MRWRGTGERYDSGGVRRGRGEDGRQRIVPMWESDLGWELEREVMRCQDQEVGQMRERCGDLGR